MQGKIVGNCVLVNTKVEHKRAPALWWMTNDAVECRRWWRKQSSEAPGREVGNDAWCCYLKPTIGDQRELLITVLPNGCDFVAKHNASALPDDSVAEGSGKCAHTTTDDDNTAVGEIEGCCTIERVHAVARCLSGNEQLGINKLTQSTVLGWHMMRNSAKSIGK